MGSTEGKGVQRVSPSGSGAPLDLRCKAVPWPACSQKRIGIQPLARINSSYYGPRRHWDETCTQWRVGAETGRGIYINIYHPLGDPVRSHKFQLPF